MDFSLGIDLGDVHPNSVANLTGVSGAYTRSGCGFDWRQADTDLELERDHCEFQRRLSDTDRTVSTSRDMSPVTCSHTRVSTLQQCSFTGKAGVAAPSWS